MEKYNHDHLWRPFRIASISTEIPAISPARNQMPSLSFVGRTCTKAVSDSVGQFDRTIKFPLTFNARMVDEGDETVSLHLTLDSDTWDSAMRQTQYARHPDCDRIIFGYKPYIGKVKNAAVEHRSLEGQ